MRTNTPSLRSISNKSKDPSKEISPDASNTESATTQYTASHDQTRVLEVPAELQVYLTTTSKPHEVFVLLQESRDHRLRLLLRRFTNQIQYGCKNPSCDVKTCLSYRKKHATTPLRPYNDVAARALAWRCLDQYADMDKREQADYKPLSTRRRNQNRTLSVETIAGLCQNEPIVPWYEDPSESGRWNKIVRGQTSRVKNPSHKQSAIVDTGRNNGQDEIPQDDIEKLRVPNTSHKNTPGISPWRTSGQTQSSPEGSEQPRNSNGVDNNSIPNPNASLGAQRHVAFAEPLVAQEYLQQAKTKDVASFTQTLYNTSSIRMLHRFEAPASAESNSASVVSNHRLLQQTDEDIHSNETKHRSSAIRIDSDTLPFREPTFKLLPLSAILWLRSAMPYDEHTSPQRDLGITTDYGPYSTFARQSLCFCLSNPNILLSSASTWNFVHPQPFKIDERTRSKLIKDLVTREKLAMKSQSKPVLLAPPGGVMVAFGMLIAITSIPEVLNHLFAALQYAYILPAWLKRTRKKDSVLAKNGQIDYSSLQRPYPSQADSQSNVDRTSTCQHGSEFVEDEEVARLCMLVVLALQLILSIKPQPLTLTRAKPLKDFGEQFSMARNSGVMFPHSSLVRIWGKEVNSRPNYQAFAARLDTMDDTSFQRILDSFTDVISHRMAISGIEKTSQKARPDLMSKTVIDYFLQEVFSAASRKDPIVHRQAVQTNLIDLLRSVILRHWNRDAIIPKKGPVGGALELLAAIYSDRKRLEIPVLEFQWKFIANVFDGVTMPIKWIEFREDNIHTHILSYSFLLEPASLVTYFRAINSNMMKKSYDSATAIYKHAAKLLDKPSIPMYGAEEVLSAIRPNMAKFFVLTIRRDNMLQDAMNQIWRRQKQEVMRPLKVRLGKDEGEDGLDHGGVQAEFFRMVLAEALDPDYGMFTTDERTRMTWFQPGSCEPLYKFEALGVLLSLAVYNGITLPITFPLAFYRKLLGLTVRNLEDVRDGWPELTRGLQALMDWNLGGDVSEVFVRTYEFSYEAFGSTHTVDMSKVSYDEPWPPLDSRKVTEQPKMASFKFPPEYSPTLSPNEAYVANPTESPDRSTAVPCTRSESIYGPNGASASSSSLSASSSETNENEAPLVTNDSRNKYVEDYIYWLVHKSISAQFAAFATGFYTCLDRTALSIFTAEHLQTVIEGYQTIDIDGLQATTTYDEYRSTDEIIKWFWEVVRDMSLEQHRHLLEFVTASDRVPVKGIANVVFIIQRNGEGDERLPSSSTCYGRLLLPRYSNKEVLKAKLEKAIENSVGFGSL